jgi:prolyl-tRNA editing enzyme YbaK/EbsC (Cys-tRNA(Pro) deacylase)
MSKSLKRVREALHAAGVATEILELGADTRTAAQAADAACCGIDQIAKSIIFRGETSDRIFLFLTAGGNQVDPLRAARCAGEPLGRADADTVRAVTGFAIGGVSPVGHLGPVVPFIDPRLMDFDRIFAAAGTPRHIFPILPAELQRITGAIVANFTAG